MAFTYFTSGAQIAAQLRRLADAAESAGPLGPDVRVWVSVDFQVSDGPDHGRRGAVDQLAAAVGLTTVTEPSATDLTEVHRTRYVEQSPATAVSLKVYAPRLNRARCTCTTCDVVQVTR